MTSPDDQPAPPDTGPDEPEPVVPRELRPLEIAGLIIGFAGLVMGAAALGGLGGILIVVVIEAVAVAFLARGRRWL